MYRPGLLILLDKNNWVGFIQKNEYEQIHNEKAWLARLCHAIVTEMIKLAIVESCPLIQIEEITFSQRRGQLNHG